MTNHFPVGRELFDDVMVPNYAPSAVIPVRGEGSSRNLSCRSSPPVPFQLGPIVSTKHSKSRHHFFHFALEGLAPNGSTL